MCSQCECGRDLGRGRGAVTDNINMRYWNCPLPLFIRGLASLSAYGTICVDSGTVFAKSMTYCVMAGNWDFTRKAFPILSPEPFSAVKFTLPI